LRFDMCLPHKSSTRRFHFSVRTDPLDRPHTRRVLSMERRRSTHVDNAVMRLKGHTPQSIQALHPSAASSSNLSSRQPCQQSTECKPIVVCWADSCLTNTLRTRSGRIHWKMNLSSTGAKSLRSHGSHLHRSCEANSTQERQAQKCKRIHTAHTSSTRQTRQW
jgi:hypothetical protein